VSWIHWDSGFRDSGLAVEDRIVALNDVPLARPEDPRARRNARDRTIGGLGESALFAEMGLKDASPLKVAVLRRNLSGRGWKAVESTGSVRATRRQVSEYWDRNNTERARDWMNRFRQSLESDRALTGT
jgi:hypothetical protein